MQDKTDHSATVLDIHVLALAAGWRAMRGFAPVLPPPGQPAVKRAGADKDRRLPEAVRAAPMPVALTDAVKAFAHRARRAEARAEAQTHYQNREQLRLLLYMPRRSADLPHSIFAPVRHGVQGRGEEGVARREYPVGARPRHVLSRYQPEARLLDVPQRRAHEVWHPAHMERGAPYLSAPGEAALSGAVPLMPGHEAPPADFERALEGYFFRQSRLPPTGTTAFDPRLTPVWAGLKLPG